jgi:hypothetical protein
LYREFYLSGNRSSPGVWSNFGDECRYKQVKCKSKSSVFTAYTRMKSGSTSSIRQEWRYLGSHSNRNVLNVILADEIFKWKARRVSLVRRHAQRIGEWHQQPDLATRCHCTYSTAQARTPVLLGSSLDKNKQMTYTSLKHHWWTDPSKFLYAPPRLAFNNAAFCHMVHLWFLKPPNKQWRFRIQHELSGLHKENIPCSLQGRN